MVLFLTFKIQLGEDMESKNEKVVIVNSMNPQSLLQVKCEDNSKIILNITFSQRHFSSQNIYSVA